MNNQLTTLPPEIGDLINLESIYANNNNITHLPAEIGNLINLETLFIIENRLAGLPAEIGNLINLRSLCITENRLASLPAEIGNLTNLRDLYLDYNSLTNLPDSIVKLSPGNILTLAYNYLNASNLSDTIIGWLDKYDPDWRDTQDTTTAINLISNVKTSEYTINIKNSSILFTLQTSGNASLQIYNIKGELISNLVDSYKIAGSYFINWDSKRFGSGIYFIKLSANGSSVSKKITIIK